MYILIFKKSNWYAELAPRGSGKISESPGSVSLEVGAEAWRASCKLHRWWQRTRLAVWFRQVAYPYTCIAGGVVQMLDDLGTWTGNADIRIADQAHNRRPSFFSRGCYTMHNHFLYIKDFWLLK